jgi:hypothetical protein
MRTPLLVAMPFLAIGLLLGACASGGGTPTPSPSPTGSASASPTPTASPEPTDPNAPAGQCADDALDVTVEPSPEGGSAGHVNSIVVFTNTGSASCELRGAPGVSVVDANGTQLGEAAEQVDDDAPPTITIEPGGTAVADLSAANIGTDGGPLGDQCPTVMGAAYLVYPPHSFTAVEVPADVPACESDTPWMTVTAVAQG